MSKRNAVQVVFSVQDANTKLYLIGAAGPLRSPLELPDFIAEDSFEWVRDRIKRIRVDLTDHGFQLDPVRERRSGPRLRFSARLDTYSYEELAEVCIALWPLQEVVSCKGELEQYLVDAEAVAREYFNTSQCYGTIEEAATWPDPELHFATC